MRDRVHPMKSTFGRSQRGFLGTLCLAALSAATLLPLTLPPASCLADDSHCTDAEIVKVDSVKRVQSALEIVRERCMKIPGPIWQAAQQGRWSDGIELQGTQRSIIVSTAIASGYAEAESLAMHALESGKWPGGEVLVAETGATLIEGMGPVLNRYRVGLFLDIYEQVPDLNVQAAVIRALVHSDRPEARLPALDAWFGTTRNRHDAEATLGISKDAPGEPMLARLVATLPEGAALDWALRIAREHDVAVALEAAKARGK